MTLLATSHVGVYGESAESRTKTHKGEMTQPLKVARVHLETALRRVLGLHDISVSSVYASATSQ